MVKYAFPTAGGSFPGWRCWREIVCENGLRDTSGGEWRGRFFMQYV